MRAASTLRLRLALLVGGFVSAAMLAALYLLFLSAAVPFPPYVLVDWIARAAPGHLLTSGIDAMVRAVSLLPGVETSTAAKLAEKATGVLLLFVALTATGAAALEAGFRSSRRGWTAPVAVGLGVGACLAWLAATLGTTPRPTTAVGWTLVGFLGWGAALGWSVGRFRETASSSDQGRRRFLAGLGALAALGAIVAGRLWRSVSTPSTAALEEGAYWSSNHPLPNVGASVRPVPGTRPELTPVAQHYRIDINATPPALEGREWRLRIGGLVGRPLSLTLDDLQHREVLHQFVTLSCISNPIAGSLIGTTRWSGTPLASLLEEAKPAVGASHVRIRSADGFDETVAVDLIRDDQRIMLTYAWDGAPLPASHGYPLRVYVPDRYGMKQPKWVQEIEVIDRWESGYWVRRGWDRDARMRATAVIDTVGTDMMLAGARPGGTRIPIGGIAHAGARGISRVEVRVDEGPWEQAVLREPLSNTTWVLWRYEWPFAPGMHTFMVRCVDGAGAAQIVEPAPPHPSGATGLHSVRSML
jgi:DMSO/TMAO reductase YedYZ molybdopterin-dependent catalytic subunit